MLHTAQFTALALALAIGAGSVGAQVHASEPRRMQAESRLVQPGYRVHANERTEADHVLEAEQIREAEAEAKAMEAREPSMSHAEAADHARQQHGGRVLSVRWTGSHYEVKLLRKGELRIVTVAAD